MPDPLIQKAAYVRGDTLSFRDARVGDAEFILSLRTDAEKSKYLSATSGDVEAQRQWLDKYAAITGQAYFIVEYECQPIGTVRLYDARGESFSWGSWILKEGCPRQAAMESALMVYAYAFDHLGFKACHGHVRKGNDRVIKLHKRFGAICVAESDLDYFFVGSADAIRDARLKHTDFLASTVRVGS